jgi:hypothetical protein
MLSAAGKAAISSAQQRTARNPLPQSHKSVLSIEPLIFTSRPSANYGPLSSPAQRKVQLDQSAASPHLKAAEGASNARFCRTLGA